MRGYRKLSKAILSALIVFSVLHAASAKEGGADKAGPRASVDSTDKRLVIGDPLKMDLPAITPGPKIALEEALRLADERNLSLSAARADIATARAGLKKTWAPLLPTAQGTMTLTHNDHEDSVNMGGGAEMVTRRQNTLQGGIQASMPLVNAQLWAGVSAGKLGVEVTKLTIENVRQELLLAVAQAFYQALTARAVIDVQENLFRTAQRHYEVAVTRHVSGVGRRLDVIRARSELVRVRQELLSAHGAYNNARDAMGLLIGKGGLPMPEEGAEPGPPVETEKELVLKAVKKRPDLKLTRKMVSLNESQLDASWMQFLPTLNATWQLTHQFTVPSAFGSQDRSRWSALLTLSVPIYNQSRYADLDEKRATLTKAMIEADNAEQNAGLEVRTARRDYQTSVKQLETAKEQAALSREALLLAQAAYESGTGTSLEVTDANRTSRQDEVTLAIKRFEIQLALLKLLKLVGEDMSLLGSPPRR
ncbi:MAG: TolC family protein [Deltaproteobacteria bacterium]|nr:TolC family protein [Deltaproteobacteria bacterium]